MIFELLYIFYNISFVLSKSIPLDLLSASNKLKIKFEGKEEIEKNCDITNKYKKNKELAKLFCLEYLNPEWEVFFKNHKKRDDLADTFLMNVYQIQIDKKK